MTLIVVIIILLLAGVFVFNIIKQRQIDRAMRTTAPPPPFVSTTIAKLENWQPRLYSVGAFAAINGVMITTQVPGIVVQLNFESGQFIKAGEPIVQLDDSVDVQNLKNNQAQLNLTRLNVERYYKLYQTGAVAKVDYDQNFAQFAQAQAQVDKALVQISQKRIRAPFTGKLGIRLINLGQYLNPGDQIVALQALDPLYINFSVPQREIKNIYVGQKISVTTDAYPTKVFFGKVTAINSLITTQTRNIDVQGTIPNPNNLLYPGVFGDVNAYLPEQKKVVTLPQTAVTYSLFGDIVYIVKPNDKLVNGEKTYIIKQQVVKLGLMVGDKVQIKSGLQGGEEIVFSGQLKLRDNMIVKIDNSFKPKPPTPNEMEGGP